MSFNTETEACMYCYKAGHPTRAAPLACNNARIAFVVPESAARVSAETGPGDRGSLLSEPIHHFFPQTIEFFAFDLRERLARLVMVRLGFCQQGRGLAFSSELV